MCYGFPMNTQFRSPDLSLTTQAAEGLMRRRWTVAEIEAMVAAGVILEDERFELIGGEVVPMSPKGSRHENVKVTLMEFWMDHRPKSIRIAQETTFRVDQDTYLEPDFLFFHVATPIESLRPENALLVVEIAVTSLEYDRGRKARLYAVNGVRELWVIDAVKLETHVHQHPGIEGYVERQLVPPDGLLTPAFAPELAVALASLELV
jgi:Uma2 family endonuclease